MIPAELITRYCQLKEGVPGGTLVPMVTMCDQFIAALKQLDETDGSRDRLVEDDELLDAGTAAGLLGHGRRFMYDHAGEFDFTVRIGRSVRFSRKGIQRYVTRRRRAA